MNGNIYQYEQDKVNYSKRSLDISYDIIGSPRSPSFSALGNSIGSPSSYSPSFLKCDLNGIQKNEDEILENENPVYKDPTLTLLGRAGIVRYHVLNDRIHILTQDSNDCILLWNVLSGRKIENLGVTNWEDTITSQFQLLSIPQWFRVDHTTGVCMVTQLFY